MSQVRAFEARRQIDPAALLGAHDDDAAGEHLLNQFAQAFVEVSKAVERAGFAPEEAPRITLFVQVKGVKR